MTATSMTCTDDVAHLRRIALFQENLRDGTAHRGRQLDRDFIGLEHHHDVVLADRVSDTLQPIADLNFRYRLAHRGHLQLDGHLSLSFSSQRR